METNNNFSACFREKHIAKLQSTTFDLLVIGGGITGAGIAFDAAHRGLNVALIEQNDFASGTSSRSTKLVHGGLRYLQQLQFKFVMQLGKERKILHDNNANNVVPSAMILPIYRGGKLNKWMTKIALAIYDKLAGVEQEYKTCWIKKQKLLKKYPSLKTKGLKGAFLYYEYKTNDGRMVIEMMKKAETKNLLALNYLKMVRGVVHNEKLIGIEVEDMSSEKRFSINAQHIVNASGAWCSEIVEKLNQPLPKTLLQTKGVHLVFEKEKLPLKYAFYFDTPDHRMIFAIPKENHVYVGTTDTAYSDKLGHPRVNEEDVDYLLNGIKHTFTNIEITKADIVSCWAGIRSLVQSVKGKTSEISRHEELFVSENGMISITGGKLTGYRLMAKKVVDLIYQSRKGEFISCTTEKIKFSGSAWENKPSISKLVEMADHKFDEAKQTGIDAKSFKPLFYRYGTNIDLLTEKAYDMMNTHRDPITLWLMTEVWYSIHYEMTCSLSGFFIYRTENILFEKQKVEKFKELVLGEMARYLGWSIERQQMELDAFNHLQKEYQI